jgi:raffinose/stachyose/melibiose transport system permease protein
MRAAPAGIAIRYVVLSLLAAAVLIPFLGIVLAALHPPDQQVLGLSLPTEISWENFVTAWNQAKFSQLVGSSLIIAAGVVFGLTLPVELVVVALYFNMRGLGLDNSYVGVILAEVALFMPFGVYWMQAHFASVPIELVEASRIDGAGNLATLLKVLLPISWPAITTLAVLYFMWSWNQFLLVLVLMQDPNKRTAPAGLGYFVGQFSTNIPLLSAASIIVVGPIVIVYLIFQRRFVSGLTQGAIK